MPASDMNLTKPTVGGSSGTWGTTWNSNADNIGEHNHTSGKGVKVPSGGINIDAALEFNAKDATELGRVAFDSSVTSSSLVRSLFVDANGDLNYRNENGVDVQITENNALNVDSFGGIEGDYAASDASVTYANTGTVYKFLSDASPETWARVDVGGLKVYEMAAGISNGITIQSPTSLAAAYSLTLPTALPGSTSLVTCTSAGVLATSTAPTLTGLTLTGATSGTTFAGTTATFNDYKLSASRTLSIPVSAAGHLNTSVAFTSNGTEVTLSTSNADSSLVLPVMLCVNDRVQTIRVYVNKTTGAGNTITVRWRIITASSGSVATPSSATLSTNNPGRTSITIISPSSPTITAGNLYMISISGGGSSGDSVYGAEVDYDRP